jgi:peptidoglycan/xylan/chitin deacetylase (PgdA/CDA1 family)
VTLRLAERLRAREAPAIGFVNERKLLHDGNVDPRRVALLEAWLDAGLDLGNHTFSHPSLFDTPLDVFQQDVLRGEIVTRRLLEARGRAPLWFRHPFLNTGPDSSTKTAFESFLGEHGYSVAPVTIDNYDYLFARAYDLALDRDDPAASRLVVDEYITYMDSIFGYYEQQSRTLVGDEFPQILLLHANRFNADNLDPLLDMIQRRGYRFITIDEAMQDSVYRRPDHFTGRAGITWLHRWAITEGVRGDVFRGEPEVPAFIRAAAER